MLECDARQVALRQICMPEVASHDTPCLDLEAIEGISTARDQRHRIGGDGFIIGTPQQIDNRAPADQRSRCGVPAADITEPPHDAQFQARETYADAWKQLRLGPQGRGREILTNGLVRKAKVCRRLYGVNTTWQAASLEHIFKSLSTSRVPVRLQGVDDVVQWELPVPPFKHQQCDKAEHVER